MPNRGAMMGTMRYCSDPGGCRQYSSGLRTDGLCFAHGKAADGLLEFKAPARGRPPSPYIRRRTPARLPQGPFKARD